MFTNHELMPNASSVDTIRVLHGDDEPEFADRAATLLQRVGGGWPAWPDLTDRQREAFRAAEQVGYDDVPRTGEMADVVAELGCSTSTPSRSGNGSSMTRRRYLDRL